jgi:glycosyltransferase A (GT-A) superfamily protein (DUF2064 family)
MTETALVIVCKKPRPGFGKQRLAVRFGARLTYEIAQALLACAFEDARAWPGPVVLSPAQKEDAAWAREQANRIGRACHVLPQIEGNLGQRLNALDRTLRNRGMSRLVFIGSDSPELGLEDYFTVDRQLESSDAVLMPAADGGVVVMANRRCWPDLSALPWSTAGLRVALVDACRKAGISVHLAREGYDIDEPDDFLRLADWLTGDNRPARRALHVLAVKTRSAMCDDKSHTHA